MGYQRAAIESAQDFHVKLPLSEQDIIDLHSMFMLQGFHHLTVRDISTGRDMIQEFLSSLDYYYNIAALTIVDEGPLPENVADLYVLLEGNYRSSLASSDIIENFFLEQFHYDFLWIEACPELLTMPWYSHIQQTIHTFNIDAEIPIFIVSYESESRGKGK